MEAVTNRIQIAGLHSAPRHPDEEIVIGKDVLELFAGAMYADPLSIFREYIQNAADAMDEARSAGLAAHTDADVHIVFDHTERSIRIRDFGSGVPNKQFVRRLTALGASGKRGTGARGFRGVGRLAGLGYCQEVIFRSRSAGDQRVKEMRWDGRVLRERLRDASFTGSLAELVRELATVTDLTGVEYPSHFFEVELRRMLRVKNDVLLNEEAVRGYLSEVAPVPFHPSFGFGKQIQEFLSSHGVSRPIRLLINDNKGLVHHRAISEFPVTPRVFDSFRSVEFFEHRNSDNELLSFGWILDHAYGGAIPRRLGIGGIRIRHGNIQVGGSDVLATLYVEPRFAGWAAGDVHVAHPRIVPNGRRDEFEHTPPYTQMLDELRGLTKAITQTIRERSDQRGRLKKIRLQLAYAEGWLEQSAISRGPALRCAMVDRAAAHVATAEKAAGKLGDAVPGRDAAIVQVKRVAQLLSQAKSKQRPSAVDPVHYAAVSAILASSAKPAAVSKLAEQVTRAMKDAARAG
jgi:hypothetical protein